MSKCNYSCLQKLSAGGTTVWEILKRGLFVDNNHKESRHNLTIKHHMPLDTKLQTYGISCISSNVKITSQNVLKGCIYNSWLLFKMQLIRHFQKTKTMYTNQTNVQTILGKWAYLGERAPVKLQWVKLWLACLENIVMAPFSALLHSSANQNSFIISEFGNYARPLFWDWPSLNSWYSFPPNVFLESEAKFHNGCMQLLLFISYKTAHLTLESALDKC